MACFIVPGTEAIVTTIASKVVEKKENANETKNVKEVSAEGVNVSFSRKLKWLSNLLWGGSALLAFEHLWHGEIVPYFPFLTAALDPAETKVMLEEMATVGGSMAVLLTLVWVGMLLVAKKAEKPEDKVITEK